MAGGERVPAAAMLRLWRAVPAALRGARGRAGSAGAQRGAEVLLSAAGGGECRDPECGSAPAASWWEHLGLASARAGVTALPNPGRSLLFGFQLFQFFKNAAAE